MNFPDKYDIYFRMQNVQTLSPTIVKQATERFEIFENIWKMFLEIITENLESIDPDVIESFQTVDQFVETYGRLITDQGCLMNQ